MFWKLPPEVATSAKDAGLRYVSDSRPGIVRQRVRNGSFRYFGATGQPVRNREQLERITIRDQNNYDRIIAFGRALPKIRRRVARDLARRGLPREKGLATICGFSKSL